MESSKINEDPFYSSWGEEVELMEKEELRASQANADPMIDEGMTTERVSMKDQLEPSTPWLSLSEGAMEEPSVPPSRLDKLDSSPGMEKQGLKKGEKLLRMEDLNEFIRNSQQAIAIQYITTDVESCTKMPIGPWVYKNK